MRYNIKSILRKHGFDTNLPYTNIYQNLYHALRDSIVFGTLNENEALPPTRLMAKDLGVSRSTVIKAYDKLIGDGFAWSKGGAGVFIAPKKMMALDVVSELKSTKEKRKPHLSKLGLKFSKRINLREERKSIPFRPGLPPLDLFPLVKWQTLSNEYWKKVTSSELTYYGSSGIKSLRKNIANYLKFYRNIECDPHQIVITTGSLHSLYLIFNVLVDKGDQVVTENPTYPNARKILEALQSKIFYAPVDKEGIDLESFRNRQPKLVYTTPSNQYPTGVRMSMDRRIKLNDWVQTKQSIIIEDDYDHEFSNWENPLPAIYSLNNDDRVVYLGTFNKLLHPSLRVGYAIVPNFMLDSVLALHQHSNRFISPYLQKTLNAFMERDYLNDHLRNIMEVTARRREIFVGYFEKHLAAHISLEEKSQGLHLIGKLNRNINDKDLSEYLGQNGIVAHPLGNYYKNPKEGNGLVMGYCSVNEILMTKKLRMMAQLVRSYKS
ncbi:PLP-dependent aminotransferase family protein [Flagellimonas sp.]|uniref:MocR-like pyridoxine biosynthesis transcription factor PdxR n=1 Tax=Flagellimonas sp. TaxID=2058762 RepID=UPI003B5025FF